MRTAAELIFQLPLSGSPLDQIAEVDQDVDLSTPSLGITSPPQKLLGISDFPFQLPLSGSLKQRLQGRLAHASSRAAMSKTFNSLSRDHGFVIGGGVKNEGDNLSTPSLGITSFAHNAVIG